MVRTCGATGEHHTGCSKKPSSKAAASEEARRTLRYVERSERGENEAGGLFQHLVRGRIVIQ